LDVRLYQGVPHAPLEALDGAQPAVVIAHQLEQPATLPGALAAIILA
jgi:hypothetical protein